MACSVVMAVLVVLGAGSPAAAQGASDQWQVTVAPYLMGAGINGTLGVAARQTTVDASASDVLSHLNFGAMGIVLARKGAWGFGTDLIWVSLGADAATPPAEVDGHQGQFAFYGLRRLGPIADVTFGLRWNILSTSLAFTGPPAVTVSGDKQWVDPLVGLILHSPPTGGKWHGALYSEIGGFGAGSTFAWQIFPTVGVDVHKKVAIDFGYRWMSTDYDSGSGVTFFKYDVLMQGPVIAFVFKL